METFDIHWDKVTLYTHNGLLLLLACIGALLIYIMIRNVDYFYIYLFFLLFSIVLPAVYAYTFAPKKYIVSEKTLIITKVRGEHKINIQDIKEIRRINHATMKKTIRTMASGGYFGYYGSFKNKQLGDFKLYGASLKENMVLIIKNDGRKIVLTPKKPEIFISKLTN